MATEEPKENEDSDDDLTEYRQWLVEAEQKSQESFDKTVLSLSGGGLGISFVFLKDVIGPAPVVSPALLLLAWVCWGLSAFAVLLSFFLSHLALRRAIRQVDSGTIRSEKAGGFLAKATASCNASGAVLFFIGVCFITAFAGANLTDKEIADDGRETKAALSRQAPAIAREVGDAETRRPHL
ncbi:hypothetical protein ATO7_16489 [Oceanococcus atlanticus]|uniref:Transmembrane protein n=1 Tax=Oceanococcus atlanticus TaxID=1317117 RepID=A0A1Y1S9P2_9GAMM|nr:hypothetical protein [Oceanococcus atlanticus]ORE84869.1 hypothetical protein ATO7_16489 [Oceanococcus atlanticus]